ncbi:hypothetical protein NON20_24690 (plasmid) [Synechocystis sp. B12]|nr:hypothetical protein NON20_24690 [Synechocystis sp. B12]
MDVRPWHQKHQKVNFHIGQDLVEIARLETPSKNYWGRFIWLKFPIFIGKYRYILDRT